MAMSMSVSLSSIPAALNERPSVQFYRLTQQFISLSQQFFKQPEVMSHGEELIFSQSEGLTKRFESLKAATENLSEAVILEENKRQAFPLKINPPETALQIADSTVVQNAKQTEAALQAKLASAQADIKSRYEFRLAQMNFDIELVPAVKEKRKILNELEKKMAQDEKVFADFKRRISDLEAVLRKHDAEKGDETFRKNIDFLQKEVASYGAATDLTSDDVVAREEVKRTKAEVLNNLRIKSKAVADFRLELSQQKQILPIKQISFDCSQAKLKNQMKVAEEKLNAEIRHHQAVFDAEAKRQKEMFDIEIRPEQEKLLRLKTDFDLAEKNLKERMLEQNAQRQAAFTLQEIRYSEQFAEQKTLYYAAISPNTMMNCLRIYIHLLTFKEEIENLLGQFNRYAEFHNDDLKKHEEEDEEYELIPEEFSTKMTRDNISEYDLTIIKQSIEQTLKNITPLISLLWCTMLKNQTGFAISEVLQKFPAEEQKLLFETQPKALMENLNAKLPDCQHSVSLEEMRNKLLSDFPSHLKEAYRKFRLFQSVPPLSPNTSASPTASPISPAGSPTSLALSSSRSLP